MENVREEMKQLFSEILDKNESVKAHKKCMQMCFILLQTCQEADLFESEIIQIKNN